MIAPGGVAVLTRPDGESVFVADFWTLREFDPVTGQQKSVERHRIGASGGITTPLTVSPDGDNLIVSSWLIADAVQVYNPNTHDILETHRDFDEPLNAIRFQGDLVVFERGTSSVVRMDSRRPEKRMTLAKGLGVPAGLAATDDDLWVCDWATGMVIQVVADGELLPEPVPVARGLSYPEGLAVDVDGSLLVVESEPRR